MQPRTIYWAPSVAADNDVCQSQTPGAAGPLTFNGSRVSAGVANMANGDPTVSTGGCDQRRIRITCAGDETGKTITLVGTRAKDGYSSKPTIISEVVALGTAGTYDSLQDFATLTQAPSISAAAAGAIKVGTNGVASTAWQQPSDLHESPDNIGLFCILDAGSMTFSVEHTLEKLPHASPAAGDIPRVLKHSVIASKTASIDGNYAFPVSGFRLTCEIPSSTGLLRFSYKQAGIPGN